MKLRAPTIVAVLLVAGACTESHAAPSSCTSSRECSVAGLVCDLVREVCVECVDDVDCLGDGERCVRNACVPTILCTTTRECPGLVCDRTLGYCVECLTEADCATGELCETGECVAAPPPCTTDAECAAPTAVCDVAAGSCVECVADTDCAAGTCGADRRCVTSFDGGSDAGDVDAGAGDADVTDVGPAIDGGSYACRPGPLGGIGVPAGSVATASASFAGAPPEAGIDGDLLTAWNPGDYTGWLRLDLPMPVAITGLQFAAEANPGTNEDYVITADGSPTPIGSATIPVPMTAGFGAPPWVLPPIAVTPGTYSSITITVDGHASWAGLSEVSLLTTSCPATVAPTEPDTLLAPDAAAGDFFGYQVALSADGTRALVGAYRDQIGGVAAGSARVFLRTGMMWAQEATLVASGGAGGDEFGWAVALSGDGNRALVGAHRDDTVGGVDAGSTHVFVRTGTTWAEEATLVASDGAGADQFGYAVAVNADGSRALVGAFRDDNAGSTRIFVRSGTAWAEEATLVASDRAIDDDFGYAVALTADGSRALVGAYRHDTAAGGNAGSAYVFRRTGTTWVEEATLLAPDAQPSDYFGWGVALSADGTRALVGAVLDDTPAAMNAGTATAFVRTGTSWAFEATLTASGGSVEDEFGTCVLLSSDGSRALVSSHLEDTVDGSNAGTARVFVRTGSSWVEQATLADSPGGIDDYFGYSLAMSADETIVLASSFADDTAAGTDAGSVSVFLLPP